MHINNFHDTVSTISSFIINRAFSVECSLIIIIVNSKNEKLFRKLVLYENQKIIVKFRKYREKIVSI
jgi:hypothetical protein